MHSFICSSSAKGGDQGYSPPKTWLLNWLLVYIYHVVTVHILNLTQSTVRVFQQLNNIKVNQYQCNIIHFRHGMLAKHTFQFTCRWFICALGFLVHVRSHVRISDLSAANVLLVTQILMVLNSALGRVHFKIWEDVSKIWTWHGVCWDSNAARQNDTDSSQGKWCPKFSLVLDWYTNSLLVGNLTCLILRLQPVRALEIPQPSHAKNHDCHVYQPKYTPSHNPPRV